LWGLDNQVKPVLQAGRHEQALSGLVAVRGYLNDPSVSALPAMRERREIDLFVVDSISALARSQLQAASTDTRSLVAAANLLTELQARVGEGDALLRAGEAGRAEEKYREALALIPEVSRAHEQLAATAALQATIQDKDAEIAALKAERDRLLASSAAGSAALQKSLEERTRELEELRSRLGSSDGGAAALQKTVQDKNAEIAALEAERDRLVAESAAAAAALRKDLADKDAELSALKAERERLLASSAVGSGDAAAQRSQRSLQERAGDLERELAAKVAVIQTLEAEKGALASQVASLKSEIEELRRAQGVQGAQGAQAAASAAEREAQLQETITRLERIQARYDQLVAGYQEYAGKEDALLRAGGDAALPESKLYLNAFLAAGGESFPRLWERIKRYDEAFERAGRAGALGDVTDILVELSLRDRPEAQALFLQSEKVRHRDNPQMVGVLDELLRVVGR